MENYNTENVFLNDVILKAKQANDYFLLIGPPGTGKTSYALGCNGERSPLRNRLRYYCRLIPTGQ